MNNTIFIVSVLATLASVAKTSHDSHECLRPCLADGAQRICSYHFAVGRARNLDASGKVADHVINGASPGPPIEICLGDTVEVVVENKLSSEQVSFHWHGIRQKDSPHMDGVPMISQCPILPYTSFRYKVKPDSSGTFFYHAHSVRQQGDGLYGSLTVRGPSDEPTSERTLLVSARPSSPLSGLIHLDPPTPDALLLNGQVEDVKIGVRSGLKYYLRIVNANVFDCPISFFVVQHSLEVIANDGHFIDGEASAERIIIYPGERFDLTVETNRTPGRYVVGIQGHRDCRGLIHEATLAYEDSDEDPSIAKDKSPDGVEKAYLDENEETPFKDCRDKVPGMRTVCSLDLKGKPLRNFTDGDEDQDVTTYYVPFDVNSYDSIHDGMTDYSFNIYDSTYFPAFLSKFKKLHPCRQEPRKVATLAQFLQHVQHMEQSLLYHSTPIGGSQVGQVNGMTFEYPSSPILSQPEALLVDKLCSTEKRAKLCQPERQFFCQCTQILQLPSGKTVDVILIDEGFGGNVSHTFHVHGYDVWIVGIGQFNKPVSKENIIEMNENGDLPRNTLDHNLRKDSFVVPNKGYVILRIHTDNIGYWLWEARSTGIGVDAPTMQFVTLVGSRESLPTVPIDFPTCGDHKSPASIFEDSD